MEGRIISDDERNCISDCIRTHWGSDADRARDPEHRDKDYEACLENCDVCGD